MVLQAGHNAANKKHGVLVSAPVMKEAKDLINILISEKLTLLGETFDQVLNWRK